MGDENKYAYSVVSARAGDRLLIDFIRLRLAFNFQFEGVSEVCVGVRVGDPVVVLAQVGHDDSATSREA